MNTQSFDINTYEDSLKNFPPISYSQYQWITDLEIRRNIAKKNRILWTDAYNRTMDAITDNPWALATMTLTFRKAPNGVGNVIAGIRPIIEKIFSRPITQAEVDFAADAYEAEVSRGGNSYFRRETWQTIVDDYGWRIPLTIRAADEGEMLRIGEPIMSIEWPRELAAFFEPLFLRVFFESTVATTMSDIVDIIWVGRIAEFGKRAAVNEDAHLDAVRACIIGGGLTVTSNDVATVVFPQVVSGGTTAHRYLAWHETENEAFMNAVDKTDKIWLLVDLIDSESGIEKLIALKKKYPNKIITPRLDSGNLTQLSLYLLRRQQEEWLLDPKKDKFVVADISNIEQIIEIESAVRDAGFEPKDYILYGLGGLLVSRDKTRDVVSAGYKLTMADGRATGKLSNDPGKEAIPGTLNIEIRDGARWIVQEDEPNNGIRVLKKVYESGELYFPGNPIEAINRARICAMGSRARLIASPTHKSQRTIQLQWQVRNRFIAQKIEI